MRSTKNLLKPSTGLPVVSPSQDIVLGCYFLTETKGGAQGEENRFSSSPFAGAREGEENRFSSSPFAGAREGEGKTFSGPEEVILAYELRKIDLQAKIRVLSSALKKKTSDTFLTIGFLNGFLPCGLVYMAVFGAIASGNAVEGSLYMMFFGLGTIPLMTTAIYFSNFLKGAMRQKIQKAIPVFVVLIGALFILRGLGLGIPYISPSPISEMVTGAMNCH